MPKVSVIIPVYNVEKYLRECLDSVINQTLKDIEIICVNDGSLDNCVEILNEYAIKDNRIIIINRENKGVAISRNEGIEKARGEFVCFIDPDDFYPTNDILETLYNSAIENNVLISGGEFSYFTSNDKTILQDRNNKTMSGYYFESDGIIEYKDYQFDYGYYRFIYNRDFLINNKIFYPNYKRFQDPPFFVHAMIQAKEFYALHKITYGYRVGHQTINWTNEKIHDLLNGITDNMRYAQNHNLEKLNEYSLIRLQQHYKAISTKLDKKSRNYIKEMCLYNNNVKNFYYNYVAPLSIRTIKTIIRNIFSITNQMHGEIKHKVFTILGIKIKFKVGKGEK